jgi:hypothetical protein
LLLIAAFFGFRVLAGLFLQAPTASSVRSLDLGVTGFALMFAYLLYIKNAQGDEDAPGQTAAPGKPGDE